MIRYDHGHDYGTFIESLKRLPRENTMETRNTSPAGVRTIKASEFKARCLKLMDEVADNGAEIVITKNGRPVSRLIPYRKKPDTLFGIDRGKLEIHGDLDEPLDVAWEAETGRVQEEDR